MTGRRKRPTRDMGRDTDKNQQPGDAPNGAGPAALRRATGSYSQCQRTATDRSTKMRADKALLRYIDSFQPSVKRAEMK